MRLTSLGVAFGLNVDVAPLPVLFQGAALLVAATAVVALVGLFYCKQKFKLFADEPDHNTYFRSGLGDANIGGCAG